VLYHYPVWQRQMPRPYKFTDKNGAPPGTVNEIGQQMLWYNISS